MNIYVTGKNEGYFEDSEGVKVEFETLEIGTNEKVIQTESVIQGLVKWTSPYAPNLDGVKRIDEMQTNLAETKLAEKEALKINYQKQANELIDSKYGNCLVQIFTVIPDETNPKTTEAKVWEANIRAHVLELSNAIDNEEPYEFDLSQFTCNVTAQDILTEISGV